MPVVFLHYYFEYCQECLIDSPSWMPTDLHLAGIMEAISFIRSFRSHVAEEKGTIKGDTAKQMRG